MGRRLMYCPKCDRFTCARRIGTRYFCRHCRKEILETGNISTPLLVNFTVVKDHISYPELNRTGALR